MKRYKLGSWTYIKDHRKRNWAKNKERERLEGIETKTHRQGYVYIFSLGDGTHKIGRSTDILSRLRTLQAANRKVNCIWSARVLDTYAAESQLHSRFKSKKVEREIFALDEGDTLIAEEIAIKYQ